MLNTLCHPPIAGYLRSAVGIKPGLAGKHQRAAQFAASVYVASLDCRGDVIQPDHFKNDPKPYAIELDGRRYLMLVSFGSAFREAT
jgi:hypothetical protein